MNKRLGQMENDRHILNSYFSAKQSERAKESSPSKILNSDAAFPREWLFRNQNRESTYAELNSSYAATPLAN